MRTVSQREFRNDSGRVLRELRDGEEFEMTVDGESFDAWKRGVRDAFDDEVEDPDSRAFRRRDR